MTPPTQERAFILDIEGMTCASCVAHVERALQNHPSVLDAHVSLASRTAAVRCRLPEPEPLINAIDAAGYRARARRVGDPVVDERRPFLIRLYVSAFLTFDVIVFSLIAVPGSRMGILAAWLLATPVQFYGGWPFIRAAARSLQTRAYTMDTLVAGGSLAAYGYSASAALGGARHAFFDTSCVIVTLILLGRVLESTARRKAGDAVRTLLERRPEIARRLGPDGERVVPSSDLAVGDRMAVLPGDAFPADGVVQSGRSSVDMSMLTGESVPVDVELGSEVVAGSINGLGRLEVTVTRTGEDTRLAGIARLLEATQASKAGVQRIADRVAGMLVPKLLALACMVAFVHWFIGAHGPGESLLRAAAVLLVACPCSLGLATPIAVMTGSGRGAELGILFKGGEAFEAGRRIDTVLLDKTGTLTEGRMRVVRVVGFGVDPDEVLATAAAVERGSEHPIARGVVRAAEEWGCAIPDSIDLQAEPGAGIVGTVGGRSVRVGRPDGLTQSAAEEASALAVSGNSVFAVWRDGDLIGLIAAADVVKEGAAEVVRRLVTLGMNVALVSGDQRAAAEGAAAAAQIARVFAEVSPADKVEIVRRLQAAGRRVAFVGDGINDAPALAQADLGVALGTGTDVAKESGDVLIIGSDLGAVPEALVLARRTFSVIRQNLIWAFAYNLLMIPLAAVGRVSPLVAAATMAGSSLTVIANALRLRRYGSVARRVIGSIPIQGSGQETVSRPASVAPTPPVPEVESIHHPVPVPAVPLPRFLKEESVRIVDALTGLLARSWDY